MRIFRIRPDVTAFGYLGIAPGEVVDSDDLVFYGQRRSFSWRPLHVVHRPKGSPRGDFFRIGHGSLVLNKRAFDLLKDVLERSGEFLSLHLQGEEVYLFNCLNVTDCLDHQETKWFQVQGRNVHVKKHVFQTQKLPLVNVFKIPQTARDRIYVVDGRHPSAVELPSIVQKNELKGLVFEEVWNDQTIKV